MHKLVFWLVRPVVVAAALNQAAAQPTVLLQQAAAGAQLEAKCGGCCLLDAAELTGQGLSSNPGYQVSSK